MTWMSLVLPPLTCIITTITGMVTCDAAASTPSHNASGAAIDFAFAPDAIATTAFAIAQDTATTPTITPLPDAPGDAQPLPSSDDTIVHSYFKRSSWRWQITAAGGTDFDDHFALAGFGVSYFIEDNFTIDFELNGLYYLQDQGDNTPGINLAMLLRWHFLIDDAKRWSTFIDAGFGIMFTSENIPFDGEEFNFTPQLGVGFTMLLDHASDARLIAGARIHHTSNANLLEDNPGSNKLMIYAGLNFPF